MPVPTSAAELFEVIAPHTYDPLPDDVAHPQPLEQVWYARPGQWELGLLHRLVTEAFAACVDVEYAATYGPVHGTACFRISGPDAGSAVEIRATGEISVLEGGRAVTKGPGRATVMVQGPSVALLIQSLSPVPAGFTVLGAAGLTVDAEVDGVFVAAGTGLGWPELPPHEVRNPIHELEMMEADGVWRLPAEVLGRVVVEATSEPRIFAGESVAEAQAAASVEQHHDLRRRPDGRWESVHELGLRYLTVHDALAENVTVEARAMPVRQRGAFACSDSVLTDIWATSAYTLRQCSHGLILDGIKRDRVPWMGDLALGTLAFAHAFGNADVVERGFITLGQNPTGYINGIVDYSLWWLIATEFYVRYFDAGDYLERFSDHIDGFLSRLAGEATPDGVLRPAPGANAYAKPIFIDWQVSVVRGRDHTSLQLLWYWALRSAVTVLKLGGHAGAGRWEGLADRLRATLFRDAWDEAAGAWREYLDDSPTDSPYPNAFAVLSGIMVGRDLDGVADVMRTAPRTRTPFITAFALHALARAGHPDLAVARIRELWSGMLEADATTFWEEFHEEGVGRLEMYGRRFGKSLCHAWGAGPAQVLPEVICGIHPLSPGWGTFEVEPNLGDLEWAGAVTPVPGGSIVTLVNRETTTVEIPTGHTLLRSGERYEGPTTVEFPTPVGR